MLILKTMLFIISGNFLSTLHVVARSVVGLVKLFLKSLITKSLSKIAKSLITKSLKQNLNFLLLALAEESLAILANFLSFLKTFPMSFWRFF